MVEWLALLIVVPAVVVPVVLLAGFAGCDQFFGIDELDFPILSAEATSTSDIVLTWLYGDRHPQTYNFERTELPDGDPVPFNVSLSPYMDHDLKPDTEYQYHVRASYHDGSASDWSSYVSARTLPFRTSFEWKSYEEAFSRDAQGWAGSCIVQRIEAVRLSTSGTKVKITLRASSAGDASIARVYISRPDPDPTKTLYDPDADLTAVATTPFVVAANTSLTLPPVEYALDEGQPLLIAVDFSATPASAIRVSDHALGAPDHVPPEEALTYFKIATEAAAMPDRTGFDSTAGFNLIYKIEVA